MKKIFLISVLCFFAGKVFAQKENFDIVEYAPPKGWQKNQTGDIISYSITNKTKKSWCQLGIVKSTDSKGSIEKDFDSEWQGLIVKNYKPTGAPQLDEVKETSGWKIKSGTAGFTFNNGDAIAMLTTISGFDRCVSVISTTNSEDYLKDIESFLASIDLKKPETNIQQSPVATDDKNSIIGTWKANASDNSDYRMKNGIMNYISRQYTFNADGTYTFISKAFDPLMNNILLGNENGTYQISGNNISVNPKRSVLEAWSKKDGADKWGKFINSQTVPIEKVTYQFTKHYFSGIQLWNLVLQNTKATQRDGPHSSNTTVSNAWYYSPISANNPVIELPNGQNITTEEVKKDPVQQTAAKANAAVIGTWGIGTTIASSYNMRIIEGSIITQYIFNADGTYSFYIKTFRYQLDKLLLTKETGTYQISGNNLTVNPQKAVIESWSKKDGTDNWGELISSQKKDLEKTTYQFFTQDFGSGMVLVLKANNVTKRDGRFNNSSSDAWFYPSSSKAEEIKLPE